MHRQNQQILYQLLHYTCFRTRCYSHLQQAKLRLRPIYEKDRNFMKSCFNIIYDELYCRKVPHMRSVKLTCSDRGSILPKEICFEMIEDHLFAKCRKLDLSFLLYSNMQPEDANFHRSELQCKEKLTLHHLNVILILSIIFIFDNVQHMLTFRIKQLRQKCCVFVIIMIQTMPDSSLKCIWYLHLTIFGSDMRDKNLIL